MTVQPRDIHALVNERDVPELPSALYRKGGDPLECTCPADHPLVAEFEEQMTTLVREYKGDGEYLSTNQIRRERWTTLRMRPHCV